MSIFGGWETSRFKRKAEYPDFQWGFPIKVSEYAKSKIDLNKSLCTCSDGTPRTKWIVPDDIDIRQKYFSDYALIIWHIH